MRVAHNRNTNEPVPPCSFSRKPIENHITQYHSIDASVGWLNLGNKLNPVERILFKFKFHAIPKLSTDTSFNCGIIGIDKMG